MKTTSPPTSLFLFLNQIGPNFFLLHSSYRTATICEHLVDTQYTSPILEFYHSFDLIAKTLAIIQAVQSASHASMSKSTNLTSQSHYRCLAIVLSVYLSHDASPHYGTIFYHIFLLFHFFLYLLLVFPNLYEDCKIPGLTLH